MSKKEISHKCFLFPEGLSVWCLTWLSLSCCHKHFKKLCSLLKERKLDQNSKPSDGKKESQLDLGGFPSLGFRGQKWIRIETLWKVKLSNSGWKFSHLIWELLNQFSTRYHRNIPLFSKSGFKRINPTFRVPLRADQHILQQILKSLKNIFNLHTSESFW